MAENKAEGIQVVVPDLGNVAQAEIIEILVKAGDKIAKEDPLITLESDKASMEIPSAYAGTVKQIEVKVGNKVSSGTVILILEAEKVAKQESTSNSAAKTESEPTAAAKASPAPAKIVDETEISSPDNDIHAGPGVRRLAREFGIDLTQLNGTGAKSRIIKEDIQAYVKQRLAAPQQTGVMRNLPEQPLVDFAKFGAIETRALSRINKLTGANLWRNWSLIPHVTQFNEADITELEAFRKQQQLSVEKQGIKLTPLAFIMKAVVGSLKKFATFNASLDSSGENLILKQYYHLGVAVDTLDGLVVPVIRNVDQKSITELAIELAEVSAKARNKQLTAADMQGSSFTISSLGGIGGTAFTPIVNLPDVAILGISKSMLKPVYQADQWVPRLMLPLSLSYDHRVIDGAEGARFIVHLADGLADIRRLLL